jgi:hypothetical protein
VILPRPHTPPSRIAARWLPALGGLLAALGVACVAAGAERLIAEVVRPPVAAARGLPEDNLGAAGDGLAAGGSGDAACGEGAAARGGSCSATAATTQPPAAAPRNPSPEANARPERPGAAAGCWGTGSGRGTRSESAHLSDLRLCPDLRHALAAMAATQYGGRGFPSRHTDDDDPEALALVVPALVQELRLTVVASTNGDDARAARALAGERALQGGDIGGVQEDRLLAVVAAAPSWDETSGYGAVETTRASFVEDVAATELVSQVSADVRWAPDAGPAWLAASGAAAARRAPSDFPERAAARWPPVEPVPAASPDEIPAALASGQRAESAHLATVPLPGEAAVDGTLAAC